ncbi:class I SAM-dependent methyltransferase [Streptomyces sp. NPDC003688]
MQPSSPAPQSTDGFSGPLRADCPWCGSPRLRTRLRAPDPLRERPGIFGLDECADCAHTFQNPRLAADDLAAYEKDACERHLDRIAARVLSPRAVHRRHRATARALAGLGDPESWLDVGTGDGRFPEAAQEFFPYTSFDGLDPTARVEKARAAGRIEEAHRGFLTTPGVTERLRARYDVVSMFHHLEHVPDPRAELRAALTVLRPGGHLVLEVPDPASAFAALLGKWWLPHGQPRHLHLPPLANLRAELAERGCAIVSTDRAAAHLPYDLTAALSMALTHVPPPLRRATAPALTATAGADLLLSPLTRRTRFANACRVVARKEGTPG